MERTALTKLSSLIYLVQEEREMIMVVSSGQEKLSCEEKSRILFMLNISSSDNDTVVVFTVSSSFGRNWGKSDPAE